MAGRPIRIAILANGRAARSDLSRTESALMRLGGVGRKVGAGIALGAGIAAAGMVKLGIDSASAASDSEQSIGATESIFKQYAKTVIERSKKASQAVGLSANEYRELNNQLGAMLKNTGKPLNEVAGLTDKLTARASDMSAMFGGTTREAVEALSAALRGETDPIERYGVSIKEANIEAYLAKKGLGDLKGEAKEQAKAQARVALIFDQTKDAAGQFARESDTLAHKQQVLKATADDLKARFGKILMPAFIGLADAAQSRLLPAIEDGIGTFKKFWPTIQKTGREVGSTLKPVLQAAGDIITGTIVPAVGDGISTFKKWWPEIKRTATSIARSLLPVAEAMVDGLLEAGEAVRSVLLPVFKLVAPAVEAVAGAIGSLPGGLISLGAQVGLAALVWPRLSAAMASTGAVMTRTRAQMTQLSAEMTYAQSRAALVGGVMGRMGGMAKQAAGIGGIMLLTNSLSKASSEGNSFSSVMQGAAGGAGIGAMFGPVGALVGGVAGGGLSALMGAFSGTKDKAEKTREELLKLEGFKSAKKDADTLRDALIGAANAYGKVSREAIKGSFSDDTKDGTLEADIKALKTRGYDMDTIVSAVMGEKEAWAKVSNDLVGVASELHTQKFDLETRLAAATEKSSRGEKGWEAKRVVLAAELEKVSGRYRTAQDAVEQFNERVQRTTGAIRDHKADIASIAEKLAIPIKQYKQWPDRVRSKIEADGLPQTSQGTMRLIRQYKGLQGFKRIKAVVSASGASFTMGQIAALQKRYKLTQPQVNTLIKLAGDKDAKAKLKAVKDSAKGVKDTKGEVKLTADAKPAKTAIDGAKKSIQSFGRTQVKSPDFAGPVGVSTSSASGVANAGGFGVGLNFSAGAGSGIAANSWQVTSAARNVVLAAIGAARSAAQIKSPSRVTAKDGKWLALGYAKGIAGGGKQAIAAARRLMQAVLGESTKGAGSITAAITKQLDADDKKSIKRLKDKQSREYAALVRAQKKSGGKQTAAEKAAADRLKRRQERELREYEKALRDRRRKMLKSTKDEVAALAANGKQREALESGNYQTYLKSNSRLLKLMKAAGVRNLQEARSQLEDARKAFADYRDAVADGVRQSASIMKLGEGNGFGNLDQMMAQRRALVAQAGEWQEVIKQLTAKGLNQTDLDALIQAGAEGGMGTAKALLAGGPAAITEMNSLSDQLNVTAKDMGQSTATTMKQAGVTAAQALVDGLTLEKAALDKKAKQLANALTKAVREALGLDSKGAAGKVAAKGKRRTVDPNASLRDGGGQVVRIHLTAQQVSQVQRGKELTADIDAFRKSGGRRAA